MTSIEGLGERAVAMPAMWAGTNVGWYYFQHYRASWIDTSREYTEWSWYNAVWQTRLAHSGRKIPTVYGDSHAGKVGREKFISWADAPDSATYCRMMSSSKLDRFWGGYGDPTN
jgi:hypothetical protein